MRSIILVFLLVTSVRCIPRAYYDISQNWVDFGMNIAKKVINQYGQAKKATEGVSNQPKVAYSVTIPATNTPVEVPHETEVTTVVVTITEPAQALPVSATIAPPAVLPPQSFSSQPSIILVTLGPDETPPPNKPVIRLELPNRSGVVKESILPVPKRT